MIRKTILSLKKQLRNFPGSNPQALYVFFDGNCNVQVEVLQSEGMPTVEYLNYEVLDDFDWELTDDNLFEKAAEAGLSRTDYGEFQVGDGQWLLDAAEARGFSWPLSCRTGSCANCAAVVISGEVDMGFQQILSQDEIENRDICLTCIGTAETEHVQIVYNAKYIDYLENRVV